MYTTPKTRMHRVEEAMSFVDIPDNAVLRCIQRLEVEQKNQTITFEEGDVIVICKAENGIQFAMFKDIHDIFRGGVDSYYSSFHKMFKSLIDNNSEHGVIKFNEFMVHFQFDEALDTELTDWLNNADYIVDARNRVYNKNRNHIKGSVEHFATWAIVVTVLCAIFPIEYVLTSAFVVDLGFAAFRITLAFENKDANRRAEEAWEECETRRVKRSDQYIW